MKKSGYLGPEGSYSHLAALRMCPDAELAAYPSFPLVMASLVSGETDCVVMPIENTVNGAVLQNIDLLQETEKVCAVAECVVGIDHRLAVKRGADMKRIKNIYSHSQALQQCARYLSAYFPSARLVPVQSTAASLEMIKTSEDAGIVGAHTSREGITLSDKNIADEPNNCTHFLLVRRGEADAFSHSRRIYFSVSCRNKSGALLGLLTLIAKHGLNMTKIQSRPVKSVPDEYRFFIEIEGDYADAEVKRALADIESASLAFKLLGCY